MGTMNAYWSEQVWYDANCRWNANVGVAANNTNRTHYLDVYVNGGVYYSNSWGLYQNIPTFWSYRFPATTTFQFFLRTWNYVNNVETDRANWGPGAYPYPPTPPAVGVPTVSTNLVARNTWDITVHGSGGTNHNLYVWNGAAWALLASGGASASYRYALPAGVLSATFLGYSWNAGPYASGPTSERQVVLYSSNRAPSSPTDLGVSPTATYQGYQVGVSWTHNDLDADAQARYQLAWWKVEGPGPTSTAWTEGPVVVSGALSGAITVPSVGTYTAMVRTWDWEGNPGPWSAQSPFFTVSRSAYVDSGGLLVPTKPFVAGGDNAFAATVHLELQAGDTWDDQRSDLTWDQVAAGYTWDNYSN